MFLSSRIIGCLQFTLRVNWPLETFLFSVLMNVCLMRLFCICFRSEICKVLWFLRWLIIFLNDTLKGTRYPVNNVSLMSPMRNVTLPLLETSFYCSVEDLLFRAESFATIRRIRMTESHLILMSYSIQNKSKNLEQTHTTHSWFFLHIEDWQCFVHMQRYIFFIRR